MRWPVFAILAYLLLVVQEGCRTLLTIGNTTPSLLWILAVFVALWAPPRTVAGAGLILGLLADLIHPLPVSGHVSDVALIGPACLGYLTGTYVAVQLRGMVFRESPIAMAVLVLVAGMFVQLVIVALLTVRGLPWPLAQPIPGWHAADELVARFFSLLYAAVLAVPLGFILVQLQWLWGFPPHHGQSAGHTRARRHGPRS